VSGSHPASIGFSTRLKQAENILVVHRGALGDFLQAWPGLCSLAQRLPDANLIWAGRADRHIWTAPLGYRNCPPGFRQAVESIPSSQTWPERLENSAVIWFGLQKPPTELEFSRLLFLPGITPAEYLPPRKLYSKGLEQAGIDPIKDWLGHWRSLFSQPSPRSRPPRVLLFPGAGHPLRCWPLERFIELAKWLVQQGLTPCFVLGPAEMERNIEIKNFEHCCLRDLQTLQSVLLQGCLAVGNDTGPLHLAGYLGVPVVSLFGPSSPAQWSPLGARVVQQTLACSPCSQTGTISCRDPVCMTTIECSAVEQAVCAVLNGAASGCAPRS